MSLSSKLGFLILILLISLSLFVPFLLTNGPFSSQYSPFLRPSLEYWLGTNSLGQDVFTQLIYGARTSIIVGIAVAFLSTLLSVFFGLISGYSRRLDPLINGFANILIVLPALLLILIITSFTGGSLIQLVVVLGFLTWAPYMRIIRASVLSLKEREFVKAASLYGAHTTYILRKHIVPHIIPLIKTKFILTFRSAILVEAGLSFLGLGDPNVISLGKMIHQGFSQNTVLMTNAWQWILLPPIMLLILLTIAVALIGEGKVLIRKKVVHKKRTVRTTGSISAGDYALQCHNVSVEMNGLTIVDRVTFNVKRGQIVSLIGKSGSGKTTLGKAIYGLLPAKQVNGTIYVNQKKVYETKHTSTLNYWKDISFIFQDPRTAFNPVLTIENQIIEVLDSHLTKEEKRERAKKVLQEVQLPSSLLTKYPHEMSGGMLSRIMIALAFIHSPSLVIADESTSALDPIIKRDIVELMKVKVAEKGSALLFTTHDMEVAYYIGDTVIELNEGKVVKEEKNLSKKHLYIVKGAMNDA